MTVSMLRNFIWQNIKRIDMLHSLIMFIMRCSHQSLFFTHFPYSKNGLVQNFKLDESYRGNGSARFKTACACNISSTGISIGNNLMMDPSVDLDYTSNEGSLRLSFCIDLGCLGYYNIIYRYITFCSLFLQCTLYTL